MKSKGRGVDQNGRWGATPLLQFAIISLSGEDDTFRRIRVVVRIGDERKIKQMTKEIGLSRHEIGENTAGLEEK